MIEIGLENDEKTLKLLYKQIEENEKSLYMNKLEFEILNIANEIKNEPLLENLGEISFSLEKDDGVNYLSVYCYDDEGDEIVDVYFQEIIGLKNGDLEYLSNDLVMDFNFRLAIKKDSNLILELAKGFMSETRGELWYKEKLSKKLYEEFQTDIPQNKTIKKNKI